MPPENYRAYALPLNPEPWALGDGYPSRSDSGKLRVRFAPNKQLQTYQNAVRDELRLRGAEMLPGDYSLQFGFSRELGKAKFMGTTFTDNASDATNMQKATEDALQGVLIGNDRDVVRVGSVILDQGPEAFPYVLIEVKFALTDEDDSRMPENSPELDRAFKQMIDNENELRVARETPESFEF